MSEKVKKIIEIDVKANDKEVNQLDNSIKGTTASSATMGATGTAATGMMGAGAKGAAGSMLGLRASVTAVTTGMKTLRGAIIATGIGALVVIVYALVQAMTAGEAGQNKWAGVMNAFKIVTGKVMDAIAWLGDKIVQAMEMGGKVIGKFAQIATKAFDMVTFGIFKSNDALNKMNAKLDETIQKAKERAVLMGIADKTERELLVDRAKADRDIANLREKAVQKEKYTNAERKKYLKEANEISEAVTAKEIANAKRRLKIKKEENADSRSDKDALMEEAQLQANLINLETKKLNLKKRLNTEIVSIDQQEKAAEKSKQDSISKSRAQGESERAKASKTRRDKEIADAKAVADELVRIEKERIENIKNLERTLREQITKAEEDYFDGLSSKQQQEINKVSDKYFYLIEKAKEYNIDISILEEAQRVELAEINDKYSLLDAKKEKAKNDLKNEITLSDQEKELEALKSKSEQRLLIADGDKEMILLIAAQEAEERFKIDEKYAKQKKKLDQDNVNQKLSAIKNGLQLASNLASLFAGKDIRQQKRLFEFQKKANMASALIDTYKGAQSAYATTVGGPIIKGLAAGVAVTAGLMNVKKIANTEFQAPTPDTTPAPTSLSGGNVSTPSFNIVGNANQNQTDELQPQKVYVVSKDVTSQQELDRNQIATSSI